MDNIFELTGLKGIDVMINCYMNNNFSGAGSYEEKGFIKTGKWVELSVNFKYDS